MTVSDSRVTAEDMVRKAGIDGERGLAAEGGFVRRRRVASMTSSGT